MTGNGASQPERALEASRCLSRKASSCGVGASAQAQAEAETALLQVHRTCSGMCERAACRSIWMCRWTRRCSGHASFTAALRRVADQTRPGRRRRAGCARRWSGTSPPAAARRSLGAHLEDRPRKSGSPGSRSRPSSPKCRPGPVGPSPAIHVRGGKQRHLSAQRPDSAAGDLSAFAVEQCIAQQGVTSGDSMRRCCELISLRSPTFPESARMHGLQCCELHACLRGCGVSLLLLRCAFSNPALRLL